MATVYLARDLRHDRLVALKLLPEELSATVGAERFVRETAIAARLNHPAHPSLFDSGSIETGTTARFLRNAICRGTVVAGASPRRVAIPDRGRGGDRAASRGGAGPRPPAWHRAPGHQARERAARRQACVRLGLRDRPCPRARKRRGADGNRAGARYAGVHEPGAGQWRANRWTAATSTVSAACCTRCWQPASVHRADGPGRAGAPCSGPCAAAPDGSRHDPEVPRAGRDTIAGQTPGRSIPHRPGVPRGLGRGADDRVGLRRRQTFSRDSNPDSRFVGTECSRSCSPAGPLPSRRR